METDAPKTAPGQRTSSIGPSGGKEEDGPEECKICLQSDRPNELIHPCLCSGTQNKVHFSCLAQWAVEKRSLTCELCKQQYHEPWCSQLRAQMDAHPRPAAGGGDHYEAQFTTVVVATGPPQPTGLCGGTWQNATCHVLVLLCLLAVILYITVFSSIAPSVSSNWSSIVWRVLIIVIPGYLLLRLAVAMLVRWRDERRERAEQEALDAAERTRVAELQALELQELELYQHQHQEQVQVQGAGVQVEPGAAAAPQQPPQGAQRSDVSGTRTAAEREPPGAASSSSSSSPGLSVVHVQGAAPPGHLVVVVVPQQPTSTAR